MKGDTAGNGPRSAVVDLAACRLFAALPEDALAVLGAVAVRRRCAAGEVLFWPGEPSDQLFVISAGHVKATINSREGRELVLHVAGRGEAPGHLDVIDMAARTARAVAVDDVELLVLSSTGVRRVLLEHPAALMDLAVDLAGMVRALGAAAGDLMFLDLPGRLAKLLLSRPALDGRVDLGVTQSELAAQLGVARQSVNRSLGSLQRRGLIRVHDGQYVTILEREALRRLAAGAT